MKTAHTEITFLLLFTPFSVTRFAMHRIYADRINSRGMSRVFCDLRSQKTPRGTLPVNSNANLSFVNDIANFHFQISPSDAILKPMSFQQKGDFSTWIYTIFITSAPTAHGPNL